MNQTMSAYASQNIGAGRQKRALEGLWKAIILSAGAALGTSLLVLGFASEFSACFDSDPAVIEQSAAFLRVTVWSYPPFATVGPLIGFIRGTGNVEASLLVGVVAQLCCRVPASFLFSRWMGFPGVGVAVLVGPAGQRFHLSLVYPHAPLAQRAGACCKAVRRVERRSGKNESPGPDRPTKKVKKQKKRPGKSWRWQSHASLRSKVQATRRMPPKGVEPLFSFKITPRRPAGLAPRRVERSDRRRPPCAANGAAGPVRR
ncbi:MAG: MATE family efflux transporter [Ruthenibacterium lactatiformans]